MDTPIQPIRLFDPARLPDRDALGWVEHPDLQGFYAIPLRDDAHHIDQAKLAEAGLRDVWVDFESDASEETQDAYEQSPGPIIRDWQPTPPSPDALLAGIWETDFGPIAYFVRPVVQP